MKLLNTKEKFLGKEENCFEIKKMKHGKDQSEEL